MTDLDIAICIYMLSNPGDYSYEGMHTAQYLSIEYVGDDNYTLEYDESWNHDSIFDEGVSTIIVSGSNIHKNIKDTHLTAHITTSKRNLTAEKAVDILMEPFFDNIRADVLHNFRDDIEKLM